jgi:hypothetical protein
MSDMDSTHAVRRRAVFQDALDDAPPVFSGVQAFASSGDTLAHCAVTLSADLDQPLTPLVRFRTYRYVDGHVSIEGSGSDDYPGYDPNDVEGTQLHLRTLAKAYCLVNAAHHTDSRRDPVRVDSSGVSGVDGRLSTGSMGWRQAVCSWMRDTAEHDPERLRDIMMGGVLESQMGADGITSGMFERRDGDDLFLIGRADSGVLRLSHWYFDRTAATLIDPARQDVDGLDLLVMPLVDVRNVDRLDGGDPMVAAGREIDTYQEGRHTVGTFIDEGRAPVAEARPAPGEIRLIRAGSTPSDADADGEVTRWLAAHDTEPATSERGRDAARMSGAAHAEPTHTGRVRSTTRQRSNIMPSMQQVVRGNLAADPKYWPKGVRQDGREHQAYAEATVYRNRRIQQADGTYADSPKGPEKTSVRFFGHDAEMLDASGFKQGDPVVATGTLSDPEAYVDKAGVAQARNVINGDTMSLDSLRITAASQRAEARANQASQDFDASFQADAVQRQAMTI